MRAEPFEGAPSNVVPTDVLPELIEEKHVVCNKQDKVFRTCQTSNKSIDALLTAGVLVQPFQNKLAL